MTTSKNAIYPKPCSRCALLGWLHHPYKSLTWPSKDECSSYAHRRACECLSWAQRCGGSALMWLLWDLRQFPGEVSHMLESRLPFALEISCSDLSRQQKRPSEKFPRHFCFYPWSVAFTMGLAIRYFSSAFNSCLNVPGDAPSSSSEVCADFWLSR